MKGPRASTVQPIQSCRPLECVSVKRRIVSWECRLLACDSAHNVCKWMASRHSTELVCDRTMSGSDHPSAVPMLKVQQANHQLRKSCLTDPPDLANELLCILNEALPKLAEQSTGPPHGFGQASGERMGRGIAVFQQKNTAQKGNKPRHPGQVTAWRRGD